MSSNDTSATTRYCDAEIQLCIEYSHNYATFRPDTPEIVKEHILGLCERLQSVLADRKQAEQPRAVPDGFVLLPRALTAENGAKTALMGEFTVTNEVTCQECDGDGYVGGVHASEACEVCDGSGTVDQTTVIDWTTIKAIYAAAVKLFHPLPTPAAPVSTNGGW